MIYFIQQDGEGYRIKVGRAGGGVGRRMVEPRAGNPHRLHLLGVIPGTQADGHAPHVRFASLRVRPDGEWFYPRPALLLHILHVLGAERAGAVQDEGEVAHVVWH